MTVKGMITGAALLLLLPALSFAQESAKEFNDRYERLIARVGADGVGVETLINKWEAAYPDDPRMCIAKFSYNLSKSQSATVEVLPQSKYLGEAPVLSLTDSLGVKTNYFQVINYDDELYASATQAIDKAISLCPDRLDYRFYKAGALLVYEKESPDMTLAYLNGLADYNAQKHPSWDYPGIEVDDEFFCTVIQEYCWSFYQIASPSAFEAFRALSERMSSYYPKNTLFLSNLGTYYLVVKKDDKTALKYYNKVLKINPKDYTSIKNCVLLARNSKNVKLEKKYLPMLIETTADETEKLSAQARLNSLSGKK